MRRKTVSGIMLTLLLIGMLILTFNIQPVKASGTIYITSDYTFTHNIYEPIVVLADNIVVDGNGYALQGTGSGTGIDLRDRSNVTIKNMEIRAFYRGIYLRRDLHACMQNTISGNNVTNNSFGIILESSSNNTLRNNDVSNNEYNFGVSGYLLSHFIQDMDDSNTVDGKPVYYWVNRRDMAVPLDAGWIALINSTHITVENLDLTNNCQGVLLASTTNSTITKNNVTNNLAGILLVNSLENTISGNNITENDALGIEMVVSSDNIISGNNIGANNYWGIIIRGDSNRISGNNLYGMERGIELHGSNNTISGNILADNRYSIDLSSSFNNTIFRNTITNSEYGIYLYRSSNNTVYHNNFVDNTYQVFSYNSTNVWDDGYPSGGNYWSDFEERYPYAKDMFRGPNQDLSGSDGIWDSQYVIDANNTDYYPLTNPWPASPSVPVGGKATPINIPMNKPETPTLWIWLTTTIILSLAATVVYVKKRKRNAEINS